MWQLHSSVLASVRSLRWSGRGVTLWILAFCCATTITARFPSQTGWWAKATAKAKVMVAPNAVIQNRRDGML